MPWHPRGAPWSAPRQDRALLGLGFWSWRDDKVGSSNNEQEDGTEQVTTEQVTTSGTKKPNEINLSGNGRNTRLAASCPKRSITQGCAWRARARRPGALSTKGEKLSPAQLFPSISPDPSPRGWALNKTGCARLCTKISCNPGFGPSASSPALP